MHTENEARALWCPMVRHEGDAGTFNRGWSSHNPLNLAGTSQQAAYLCNCIASSCAAWRWSEPAATVTIPCPDALAAVEPARPEGMPEAWAFIPCLYGTTQAYWAAPEDARPRHGYCGLFNQSMIR